MKAIRSDLRKRSKGFSLIELTVVLAIMLAIGLISIPLLGPPMSKLQRNYDVESLIQFIDNARNYAMSKNSFVWVGFRNPSSSSEENSFQEDLIYVVAMESLDGTATANGESIKSFTKPQSFQNWKICGISEINPKVSALALSEDFSGDITLNTEPKGLRDVKGNEFPFTITFSPSGEAFIKGVPTSSDGYDREILIGFCRVFGGASQKSDLDFLLKIDGGNGKISILKLE